MAIWLAVFLGPLIAIGIIAAAIKGAQALLASDGVIRLLMSRPVAIVATVIMAGIGLLFAYGFFQLWESTPWAAALARTSKWTSLRLSRSSPLALKLSTAAPWVASSTLFPSVDRISGTVRCWATSK